MKHDHINTGFKYSNKRGFPHSQILLSNLTFGVLLTIFEGFILRIMNIMTASIEVLSNMQVKKNSQKRIPINLTIKYK